MTDRIDLAAHQALHERILSEAARCHDLVVERQEAFKAKGYYQLLAGDPYYPDLPSRPFTAEERAAGCNYHDFVIDTTARTITFVGEAPDDSDRTVEVPFDVIEDSFGAGRYRGVTGALVEDPALDAKWVQLHAAAQEMQARYDALRAERVADRQSAQPRRVLP